METLDCHTRGIKKATLMRVALPRNGSVPADDELVKSESTPLSLVGADGKRHVSFNEPVYFRDGDILLVSPPNQVTVVYKAGDAANAILLTERCNCRCLTCPQPPKRDEFDTIAQSLQLIRLISDEPRFLCITGGEPTLLWDGLGQVIRAVVEKFPAVTLDLLTNGRTFKDAAKARMLFQWGQGRVRPLVSLYADTAPLHDRLTHAKGAFWETIAGLRNLCEAGFPIEIRVVLVRDNIVRLPEIAEFIYRNLSFVAHVALMGMEPVGLAIDHLESLWFDPMGNKEKLRNATLSLSRRGINVSVYNLPHCVVDPEIHSYCRRSISPWKQTYTEDCAGCIDKTKCSGIFMSQLALVRSARYSLSPIKGG